MLSSFGKDFSTASAIGTPVLIVTSFLIAAVSTSCQPNPANRPPAVPYTAEFKTTSVSTLANGTTITRETKTVQARDSQWRSINQFETAAQPTGGSHSVDTTASISDPVEGTQITWQSRTHEAWVTKLPPHDQRRGCWADESGAKRAVFNTNPSSQNQPSSAANPRPPQQPQPQDLGTSMMEGVEVTGRRITRIIPAGQIGNDQPIVVTNEIWSAPSLGGLTLKSVNDDPRGKTTREITHLDLGEPDPALFQPPAGYEVKIRELHQVPCDQNRP